MTAGSPSLPVPASPLIGRDEALLDLTEMVARQRMVTIVGTAGVGKTRLAVEAAAVVNGSGRSVAFVDGARLRHARELLPAVARSLGLSDAGPRALSKTMETVLAETDVLLVLDNLEHLVPGAAHTAAALLSAGPQVRVLATSRAPTHVPGEHLVVVRPLTVPASSAADLDAVRRCAAVTLFAERVAAVVPGFAVTAENARVVAEICTQLDGLPLALELAAPHVRTRGLAAVLDGTRHRLDLLHLPRRATEPRHRSLAHAFGWSVELLQPTDRRVFEDLSVFVGGWSVSAATEVCGPEACEALAELADQSLIEVTPTRFGARYRMLQTLREWGAAAVVERRAEQAVRGRHLEWVESFADGLWNAFGGDAEADWLDRAEAEHANVLAALDACGPERADVGLRIAAGTAWFWDVRGHLATGRARVERMLAEPGAGPSARAFGLDALGRLALSLADHCAARQALEQSVEVSRAAGDRVAEGWATSTLAFSAYMTGDVAGCAQLARHSVACVDAGTDHRALARALTALAVACWVQGRRDEARELFARAETVIPAGWATWGRGRLRYFAGWAAYVEQDDARAGQLLADAAGLLTRMGDRRAIADCCDVLGALASRRGDAAAALRLLDVARRVRRRSGVVQHAYLAAETSKASGDCRRLLGDAGARRIEAGASALTVPDVLGLAPSADGLREGSQPPMPTSREWQVADAVASGMTNRQIARLLGISERTAERHVENLRRKLGAVSRTQIAAWAAGHPVPTQAAHPGGARYP